MFVEERSSGATELSTVFARAFEMMVSRGGWSHVDADAPDLLAGAACSRGAPRRALRGRPGRARGADRGRRLPARRDRHLAEVDVRGEHASAERVQEPARHDPRRSQLARRARGASRGVVGRSDAAGSHPCRMGRDGARGRLPPASRAHHPAGRSEDVQGHLSGHPTCPVRRRYQPRGGASPGRLDASHAQRSRRGKGDSADRLRDGLHHGSARRTAAPPGRRDAPRDPPADGWGGRQEVEGRRRPGHRAARSRRCRPPASDCADVAERHSYPGGARHGDPQCASARTRRQARAQAALARGGASTGRGRAGRTQRADGRFPHRHRARPRRRDGAGDPRSRRDDHGPRAALPRIRGSGADRGLRPDPGRGRAGGAARCARGADGPGAGSVRPRRAADARRDAPDLHPPQRERARRRRVPRAGVPARHASLPDLAGRHLPRAPLQCAGAADGPHRPVLPRRTHQHRQRAGSVRPLQRGEGGRLRPGRADRGPGHPGPSDRVDRTWRHHRGDRPAEPRTCRASAHGARAHL